MNYMIGIVIDITGGTAGTLLYFIIPGLLLLLYIYVKYYIDIY